MPACVVVLYSAPMDHGGCLRIGSPVGLITLLALLFAFGLTVPCLGDQLQWTPLTVCRIAADAIVTQPLLVSYCSQAEQDFVEVWWIRNLEVVATSATGLYEIMVSGRHLYRSDRAYSSEEFPVAEEQWAFHKAENTRPFVLGIDLAYVYVYTGGGTFRCLATVLGLECTVTVESIRLPGRVMEELAFASRADHNPIRWWLDIPSTRPPQPGH